MDHSDVVDQLAHMLAGVTPDVLEQVLNSVSDSDIDFGAITHEAIIEIVSAAVFAAAGTASKQYLQRNREDVHAAITRGLNGL